MAKAVTQVERSKAEIIREFLGKYPDKGPTELAEMVSKEAGKECKPTEISVYKNKMRQQNAGGGTANGTVRRTKKKVVEDAGVGSSVDALLDAARALGKDRAVKILSIFDETEK